MKKLNKKHIKKEMSNLWSLIIRSKGYCEICLNPFGRLNAHHIIGKRNYNLRWDLRNGLCCCVNCHKLSDGSIHDNPITFIKWFKAARPDDYEYLDNDKWNIKVKRKLSDYINIYNNLKDIHEKKIKQ